MSKFWQGLAARYAVLSQRERILIWSLVLVAFLLPTYLMVVEPKLIALDSMKSQTAQKQNEIITAQNLTQATLAKLKIDPNKQLRQQQEALELQLIKIDQALIKQQAGLISVERMPAVLEQLLSQIEGLELVEMVSLAPEPVLADEEGSAQGVQFHRQGIRLTLDGGYFNLLNYLESIEGLQDRFLWRVMNYQVEEFPDARIILELYSLGSSKDFISG